MASPPRRPRRSTSCGTPGAYHLGSRLGSPATTNNGPQASDLVGMPGFEPGASCSQSRRANQAAPHPVLLTCENAVTVCGPGGQILNSVLPNVLPKADLDRSLFRRPSPGSGGAPILEPRALYPAARCSPGLGHCSTRLPAPWGSHLRRLATRSVCLQCAQADIR